MSEEILNELQLLTAMYDPSDITFHDPTVKQMVENCIPISDSVSLSVRLNDLVELDIRLPLGYPLKERVSAHCRLSKKNPADELDWKETQQWETQFNSKLKSYLGTERESSEDEDENPNVLGVIQWCNEQFEMYPPPKVKNDGTHKQEASEESCRIWIFSHHIYNKNKRKFLVNTAEELDLSGFSLPGKPGFICVEGDPSTCDEYWTRVRQLTWQKISLIERQSFPSTEVIFQTRGFEELHLDKSAFIKYLEEKNSSSIIKDYLGI